MARHGKNYRDANEKVDPAKHYKVDEAISMLKRLSFANFDESVDASINLNVNPRHADQMVRGSMVLPHGRGKDTTVVVFAKGEHAQAAVDAGADFVGAENIVERITEENWTDFDVAVATPDMMGQVGRIGRILGPRGLMPNPKSGTVTFDIEKIVKELKAGRVEFRVDKAGIIHLSFARRSFPEEHIKDNLMEVVGTLARLRPASAKAPYFRKISLSTTMSPGLKLDAGFARELL
ncbi:MAG: 50S ribosomal protein L1 [Myxococcota bacterium]